jgi:hypothetical protein
MLAGTRTVYEAIGTAKSLYRFLTDRPALVLHDDGTLGADEHLLLARHLPGIRVLDRRTADAEIRPRLQAQGLTRSVALRDTLIFGLKLFDLRYYSRGKTTLYLDSDILFHRRPDALIEAIRERSDRWVHRYNEDVVSSYSWTPEQVRQSVGVDLLPRVNAGFTLVRQDVLPWDFYEECLASPIIPGSEWYVEQTLCAIDFSRLGARALPPDYDVCFRYAYGGGDYEACLRDDGARLPVVTQHYCGGELQRAWYYRDFIDRIAPELRA